MIQKLVINCYTSVSCLLRCKGIDSVSDCGWLGSSSLALWVGVWLVEFGCGLDRYTFPRGQRGMSMHMARTTNQRAAMIRAIPTDTPTEMSNLY